MTTLEYHPYTKWNPLNYPIIVTGIIEVLSLVIWLDAIFWHRFGVAAVLCHGFGIAMVSTTIFIFDGVVFIDIIQSGKLIGYYQQRADLRDIKDIARKSDEYPEITRYFLAADSAGNDISNIDVIKIQRYVRRIENKQAHRQEKEKKKEEMRLLAEQQEKKFWKESGNTVNGCMISDSSHTTRHNQMLIEESLLPQGSAEWLSWRKRGIGGSEIYSLACRAKHWLRPLAESLVDKVSPPQENIPGWVTTPRKIWKDKHGLLPPLDPRNHHLQRGHRVEPIVRNLAEETWNCELKQLCGYAECAPYSRVSLDGYSPEKGILIEVKAPYRFWEHCPDYPVWQSAYQAAVLRKIGEYPVKVSILEGNEIHRHLIEVKEWPVIGTNGAWSIDDFQNLGNNLMKMAQIFWESYMDTDTIPNPIPRERL